VFTVQPPQHRTKSEFAVHELRLALVRGELGEDRRLTLSDLQETLGMSSTPIVEAIRILETEGLLQHEPYRGVRVRSLALAEVAELYLLRIPLERIAGELAAASITKQQLSSLAGVHKRFARAAAAGDDARMTQVNADFHYAIYLASDTQRLAKLVVQLWVPYFWGRNWELSGRSESVDEHAAILDALGRHDSAAAGGCLERHTRRVYDNILRELEAPHGVRDHVPD
jgi:DNA-binding GntR family transcriptional regulator